SFDLVAVGGLQAGRRPHNGLTGTERRALLVDELAFAQDPVRIRIERPDAGPRREGGGVDPLTGDPDLVLVDPPGRYALVVAVLERGPEGAGLPIGGPVGRHQAPPFLGVRDLAALALPAQSTVVVEVEMVMAGTEDEEVVAIEIVRMPADRVVDAADRKLLLADVLVRRPVLQQAAPTRALNRPLGDLAAAVFRR